MIHNFIVDFLHIVCSFERIRMNIMFLFMNRLLKKYQFAIVQIKLLLKIKLEDISTTLNHYFNENLEK